MNRFRKLEEKDLNDDTGRWLMEVIAWLFAIGFGTAFFSNTKANVVSKSLYDTYTLEYWTTTVAPDMFDFAFERTAEQLCPDGYKILDKTNRPGDPKVPNTRWLISCENKPIEETED